jgi:hypothetical protein
VGRCGKCGQEYDERKVDEVCCDHCGMPIQEKYLHPETPRATIPCPFYKRDAHCRFKGEDFFSHCEGVQCQLLAQRPALVTLPPS